MSDSLGDRMKVYEKTFSTRAVKRTPLMVRVDGRAFHTFTKYATRPFDNTIMNSMVHAAREVAKEIQGFKVAYVQSDEATFVMTDYDELETQGWFDYKIQKIVSITAALMSVHFNNYYSLVMKLPFKSIPVFDSRAYTIPREEVVNAFLWRAQDWKRNSIQMIAQYYFSHQQLHGKNVLDMTKMLSDMGVEVNRDFTDQERNGTFIINDGEFKDRYDVIPSYDNINQTIGHLF